MWSNQQCSNKIWWMDLWKMARGIISAGCKSVNCCRASWLESGEGAVGFSEAIGGVREGGYNGRGGIGGMGNRRESWRTWEEGGWGVPMGIGSIVMKEQGVVG
ncbi:hypothetical protein O181_029952 [Austropuccinia psidii MF-1]|uniref:Uncharacterized protein n=1 Tax=Austropuccinia psidii MF-1 TaxID=1389203 RepID=A0A9Q3CUT6_9BASI|nr:hypothetical protein [Austropuccinia psidii MF-1]